MKMEGKRRIEYTVVDPQWRTHGLCSMAGKGMSARWASKTRRIEHSQKSGVGLAGLSYAVPHAADCPISRMGNATGSMAMWASAENDWVIVQLPSS
jgi:hypothetical protein